MQIEYVPLLPLQRELQEVPRGMGRFHEYLRKISNRDGTDIALVPMLIANPMAREHVTELLDALLELEADSIGARAAAEACAAFQDLDGDFKATLVVADNMKGGWTNRFAYEHDLRHPAPGYKRFWVTSVAWSSEPAPTAERVRESMLMAVYRTGYVLRHGRATTLRDLLTQEGSVMAAAQCEEPTLENDDLEYTREVVTPFLDETDMRTKIECLFGDVAARTLGFTPRGLSPWAGLALALHDARQLSPSK